MIKSRITLKQLEAFYAVASYDDPATHPEYSALLVKQAGAVGLFYGEEGHFLGESLPELVLDICDRALMPR